MKCFRLRHDKKLLSYVICMYIQYVEMKGLLSNNHGYRIGSLVEPYMEVVFLCSNLNRTVRAKLVLRKY